MKKYKKILLIIFLISWFFSGYNALYFADWLLENILVLLFFIVIMVFGKKIKLNNISYTLIIIFLILHLIGAHYSYNLPFGKFLGEYFQVSSFEGDGYRDMYDRLVHFSYGFLLFYPFKYFFINILKLNPIYSSWFSIQIIICTSTIYELMEWGIASIFYSELGMAFLGSQGDIWDAQKDIFSAIIGAIISALIYKFIKKIFNR